MTGLQGMSFVDYAILLPDIRKPPPNLTHYEALILARTTYGVFTLDYG